MAKTYTFYNADGSTDVSEAFVLACQVFKDLIDDTDISELPDRLQITDNYDMETMKKLDEFYTKLNNLSTETEDNKTVSILDYVTAHQDEYIRNYTDKNLDPPHCKELAELLTANKEHMKDFIISHEFFHNPKLMRGIMLCYAAFIRTGPQEQVDEIMSQIMEVLQDNV